MRGRQKRAILPVLVHPLTETQICQAAQSSDPHILLRDVWYVLRQMQKRSLVQCLNPGQVTGRLYCLTDFGRKVVRAAFNLKVPPLSTEVPWKKYSLVVRAKTRRMVVLELGEFASLYPGEATAAQLRKHLNQRYPIGLNPIMRTLKELVNLGIVERIGVTRLRQRNIYRLTKIGERIREQLLKRWGE